MFDYDERFLFTKTSEEDLNTYDLEGWLDSTSDELLDYFEYGERSKEELDKQFYINIQRCLGKFYDKGYIFDRYKNDWILFGCIDTNIVDKMIRLIGLDREEVYCIRDGNATEWPI